MARIDYGSYDDVVWGFSYQMEDQELFTERLSPLDAILPTVPREKNLSKGAKKVTRKIRNSVVGQIFN